MEFLRWTKSAHLPHSVCAGSAARQKAFETLRLVLPRGNPESHRPETLTQIRCTAVYQFDGCRALIFRGSDVAGKESCESEGCRRACGARALLRLSDFERRGGRPRHPAKDQRPRLSCGRRTELSSQHLGALIAHEAYADGGCHRAGSRSLRSRARGCRCSAPLASKRLLARPCYLRWRRPQPSVCAITAERNRGHYLD